MKNLNFTKKLNLRSFALVGILAIAVFAVSCQDDADVYTPTAQEADLKSGKAIQKGEYTIAEIVYSSATSGNPQFTLLLAALDYAGLTGVFAGTDQFTVFAPTDAAFVDLVVALGADPNDPFNSIDAALGEGTVKKVLLYHVTEGRRAANSVLGKGSKMKNIESLLGQTFKVDASGNIYTASLGMSSIITSSPGGTFNISASNGIIHVIDAVMVPEL